MEIKHPFFSPKGDGPDSTLVRPSNWNAGHTMTISAPSRYVGKDKTGAGAAQELPVVTVLGSDDGTMWSAAKVQEYVTAAIAAGGGGGGTPTDPMPLGMIVGSINGNMPGFLPLDGTTFGRVGSSSTRESALYQNLYEMMWLNPFVPVEGGRGANGPADWSAGKSMTLPASAGTVLGAQGVGLGFPDFFTVVGADSVPLVADNLPPHTHPIDPQVDRTNNSGLGGAGSGNSAWTSGVGALTATGSAGLGTAHPNIQRTMIMHVWWIKY